MGTKIQTKKYKIAIKTAIPRESHRYQWGDYYLALGLKREFEKKGHSAIIQIYPEWYDGSDSLCDIVLVLRGLRYYKPKNRHINILWNISHPDTVKMEEINKYDYVFISSFDWAEEVSERANVPVEPLLQCTDPGTFSASGKIEFKHELLFVGNTRKTRARKIIMDLLPTNRQLAVYGKGWKRFISKKYIKGIYIPNHELYKYYGSCDILLNDHWDDMREKGFINNRIFDALASETFIISDRVKGIEKVFGGAVKTYGSIHELHELIEYYLAHAQLRKDLASRGAQIVRSQHTYANRVEKLLQVLKNI